MIALYNAGNCFSCQRVLVLPEGVKPSTLVVAGVDQTFCTNCCRDAKSIAESHEDRLRFEAQLAPSRSKSSQLPL